LLKSPASEDVVPAPGFYNSLLAFRRVALQFISSGVGAVKTDNPQGRIV